MSETVEISSLSLTGQNVQTFSGCSPCRAMELQETTIIRGEGGGEVVEVAGALE